MTVQAAHAFLKRAEQSEGLRDELDRAPSANAYKATLRHKATQWGYTFSSDEYQQALHERYSDLTASGADTAGGRPILKPGVLNTDSYIGELEAPLNTYGPTFFPTKWW